MTPADIPDKLDELRKMAEEPKFLPEDFIYPGPPTEDIRFHCEQRVNLYLEDLTALLRSGAPEEAIFSRNRELVASFLHESPAEYEKLDEYLIRAMTIAGVEDWIEQLLEPSMEEE